MDPAGILDVDVSKCFYWDPPRSRPVAQHTAETMTDGDAVDDAAHDARKDDDEASSGMDLSEPSRLLTPTSSTTTAAQATVAPNHAGSKRKLSDADGIADGVATDLADEQTKKRKLSADNKFSRTSVVPSNKDISVAEALCQSPAILQLIFSHLPPAMLCRCLRVCKQFNHLLTGARAPHGRQKDKSAARIVDSEAIWIQSRKTYFPQLPRPLRNRTELQMLQLVGGQACQFCRRPPVPLSAPSIFNNGPGTKGVRVLFPFGVRTCGSCIEPLVRKDVHTLAEPVAARLRLGITYAFRNAELHYMTETVRQAFSSFPESARFCKVYYHPDLVAIEHEEKDAQQLGEGAYDEWRKGLYNRGRSAMVDSARWENWETGLRPGANLAQVLREYDMSSFPLHVKATQSRSAEAKAAHETHPLPQPVHVFHNGHQPSFPLYQQLGKPAPQQHPLPFPPPLPNRPPVYPPFQQPQQRMARSPQEVESARQARKADIERRCSELEPPVEPAVLQHMESFQAAIQITTPLTDATWDMLKPRILAQREAAELAEHLRASQLASLQAAALSHWPAGTLFRPGKEMYDREYEDAQMPLRKRLGEYADDITNGRWGGGMMLDRASVPIFAVEVLLYVRRRYLQDKQLGLLSELEPVANKPGTTQPTPFLSLDNMKWVYDHKVRLFTDKHRKELFICAGCDDDMQGKWFAFEGLVQHYGAKHTSEFSRGNIIVHWQTAEWPQRPPFHTNPALWIRPKRPRDACFQYDANGIASASGSSEGREWQHLKLANDAREIWNALDGIKDLLECVKVQAVLHHAVAKFYEQHLFRPSLDLLTDALGIHNATRPLKKVTGLACKSCVAAGKHSHSNSYFTRTRGIKLLSTSQLVTHFKLIHQAHDNAGPLDWVKDMIELPEKQILRGLLHTPGMDDDKLALIAAALPAGTFPMPLPVIGHVAEKRKNPSVSDEATFENLIVRKKQKKHAKKLQKASNSQDGSQETLPEPKEEEEEYDPLRPALISAPQWDPALFDTDARKQSGPVAPVTQAPPQAFKLNDETMVMLQNMKSTRALNRTTRGATAASTGQTPLPAPNITADGQPDIAAILAALTIPGQAAAPPAPTGESSGIAHGRDPRELQSGGQTDARYFPPQQAHPLLAAVPHVHELQAALSHNRRQYEQNHHHSVTERPYSTGPHPQQHRPPPQLAPQYQVVYEEDRPYSQAVPHAAIYREAPQPQYVQVPEHQYAPHGYQYEVPVPQTIYVDQDGRRLIPIDPTPAPVQYFSNRYEQQHYARPFYTSAAPQPAVQPVYDDRRPVYYERTASVIPPWYTYDGGAPVGRP